MPAEARVRTGRAAIDARRREAQPALASILGGLLWALVGFVLGVAITALVRTIAGAGAWSFEQSFAVGCVFALSGWLLGVGVWDRWALEWLGGGRGARGGGGGGGPGLPPPPKRNGRAGP